MPVSSWRLGTSMMTSRRLGLFLCLVGFVWGLTLMNMTLIGYNNEPESEHLKGEILQLSEKYVKELAKETENAIDGPYSGRLTGYDLKKTMAVLLQNILERLSHLERRVDQALANRSLSTAGVKRELEELHAQVRGLPDQLGPLPRLPKSASQQQQEQEQQEPSSLGRLKMDGPVDAKGLIMGEQEKCELEEGEVKKFMHCQGKINWMRAHWRSDPCYKEYGVDGSDCSFRMYLSEVETWCPRIPGRTSHLNQSMRDIKMAGLNLDINGLLSKLQDPGQRKNYMWIRMRISRMWSRWVAAAINLDRKEDLSERKQKKVLVHLGLLTKQSGFKIAEGSFKGGPLGELVQWSDIVSALYILGHDLTITSEVEQLQAQLGKSRVPKGSSSCPPRHNPRTHAARLDIIYTDIVGLRQMKRLLKGRLSAHSCLLRIIDSFGTEPAFNFEPYAKTHHMKTQWGMQNLNPQQFFTMFPHSPDNSFMGFVVENYMNDTNVDLAARKNQAVVYGKAQHMWQGKESYLNIIREFADIHGTVFLDPHKTSATMPPYIYNHGLLKGPDLHRLLRESKLFIGLGFPYEGPAPLEAIAQGCVFINPKFSPPHSSINTLFFKSKPTRRQVTSQHPYAEQFIGEPHVFTVDIGKPEEVRWALRRAMSALNQSKVLPYLPYEFTEEGMLQRVNGYLEHQDFCDLFPAEWPPAQQVVTVATEPGESCAEACMRKRLLCEPSHFKRINTRESLEKAFGACDSGLKAADIYFPAVNRSKKQCLLQDQTLLFSCVGQHPSYARLCPCRDYMPGQIALCKDCVRWKHKSS